MNRTLPPAPFLSASTVVDFHDAAIAALASSLHGTSVEATAKSCFDWVRDNIEHSVDFKREQVTVNASDVLKHRTGLCYAKSHLLVALLRANRIAAGFCYQRLVFGEPGSGYCSHGLVAVRLPDGGWYRCDPRGNSKPGITCEFTPGRENLAFPVIHAGEKLFSQVWAEPWPDLVRDLASLASISQYCENPIDLFPPQLSEPVDQHVIDLGQE